MLYLTSGESVLLLIPWGCNQITRQRGKFGTFRFHFCPFDLVSLSVFIFSEFPLPDYSLLLLFLQYWSSPSRLRAALREQWKSADIISQDPVIVWLERRRTEMRGGRQREGG